MYKSHLQLVTDLSNYSSPKSKITRMINSKEIIQVKRGIFLYANDNTYSINSISSIIYGPSYISFEKAMSFYGLIPEKVTTITCATFNKKRNKQFHTPIGNFHYFDVPPKVFPYDTVIMKENGQNFVIASMEKAICDSLYKINGIKNTDALSKLIKENWRIDLNELSKLDRNSLQFLLPLYKRKICNLFAEWFIKEF
ncbi:MAG: hypothetical protein U9N34_09410 [Candidatus Cloacimonadota bacterium]|nr:hypothetical protein [Candidatus Cloacimonadota bacterium]